MTTYIDSNFFVRQKCPFADAFRNDPAFESLVQFLPFRELARLSATAKEFSDKVQSSNLANVKKLSKISISPKIFQSVFSMGAPSPFVKVEDIASKTMLDWHNTAPCKRQSVEKMINLQFKIAIICDDIRVGQFSLDLPRIFCNLQKIALRLIKPQKNVFLFPSPHTVSLILELCSTRLLPDTSSKISELARDVFQCLESNFERSFFLLEKTAPLCASDLNFHSIENYAKNTRKANQTLERVKFAKAFLDNHPQLKKYIADYLFNNSIHSVFQLNRMIYELASASDESAIDQCEGLENAIKKLLKYRIFWFDTIELDFAECRLTVVPEYLEMMKNLKILRLNDNFLAKLPKELTKLKHLFKIDLACNNFEEVPPVIFEFANLEVLVLDNNPIGCIPNDIYRCRSLINLQVNACGLSELPEELEALNILTVLSISHNYFTDLPGFVFLIPNLTIITAANNHLEKFPEGIVDAKQLEFVNFSRNKIKIVPRELTQLTRLEDLYLSENQIEEVSFELRNLRQLSTLDLRNNKIFQIDPALESILRFRRCEVKLKGNPIENRKN